MQQVGIIKDRDGNMSTGSKSVLERLKENFKELMNEEIEVRSEHSENGSHRCNIFLEDVFWIRTSVKLRRGILELFRTSMRAERQW